MLFADFMNWALDQSGVSNYKLAKRLGISQTTVANWLNGVTEPRKKQRSEVLDIFGVDEDDLEVGFPEIHYKDDPTLAGQKEKPPAQGGEPMDPETQELIDFAKTASADELRAALGFTRLIVKQRGK